MKRIKSRKHIIQLPNNYGEILILTEIKFTNGERSLRLIKELLYLYSMGMEYYDSINNHVLYSYYCKKNVAVLTDPDVVSFLDNNPKVDLLTDMNLFNEDKKDYKNEKITLNRKSKENIKKNSNTSNHKFLGLDNQRDISILITRPINNNSRDMVNSIINQEIDKLKSTFDKINYCIEKEISNQAKCFLQRKLKKLGATSMKSLQSSGKKYLKRKGSNIDDIIIAAVSQDYEGMEQSTILQSIYELSEKKLESNQLIIMKEIEDYIDKSMLEMHIALEELKVSFEDEIKGLDEDIFPDVVKALKEDMEFELSHLRDQYEESRRDGVEKIRAMYSKKK